MVDIVLVRLYIYIAILYTLFKSNKLMTYLLSYSTKTIDLWRYLLLIGIKSVICTS